jgi:AcrR family transcriptional regulator
MPTPTRRERLRAEMRDAILEQARLQVVAGGAEALSINAIARVVGTSGPALYRYFGSREELLAAVAAAAYDDLADAMRAASDGARRRRPASRFRAVATAYRDWALSHPNLYRLLFGEPAASGATTPELLVPAAHRAMLVLLEVLAELPADPSTVSPALRDQLSDWARERDTPPTSPGSLIAAIRAWTRLHGVLGLELSGAFASMGLDGGDLYAAEVTSIVAPR